MAAANPRASSNLLKHPGRVLLRIPRTSLMALRTEASDVARIESKNFVVAHFNLQLRPVAHNGPNPCCPLLGAVSRGLGKLQNRSNGSCLARRHHASEAPRLFFRV